MCLDTTNGETLASIALKNLNANDKEKELFALWEMILKQAKETSKYNETLTYGIYQIYAELNTFYKDEETGKTVYNYPGLQGNLMTLKTLIKEYYSTEIVPTLFEYEFLK